MAQPTPGELDGEGADMDVAGLADAEVAREATAGLARIGETGESADLAAIAKAAPGEELQGVKPGADFADAAEGEELPDLVHGGVG